MKMSWSSAAITRVGRWVELRLAIGRRDADQRRRPYSCSASPKDVPGKLGLGREVDLVAVEVEQVHVDDRQARRAARLGGDAADQVATRTSCARSRLASRATSTLRASRISATMLASVCPGRQRGSLVTASNVLTTSVSGSSISGAGR